MVNRLVTWDMYQRYFRFENQIHSEKRRCYSKVVDKNKVFLIQTDISVYFMTLPDEDERLEYSVFFPQTINVVFELVNVGKVGRRKTFIFKPHVTNNNELSSKLEFFNLLMPDYLFFDLLERLMFYGKTEWKELFSCDIIWKLSINEINFAGLYSEEINDIFSTDIFNLKRVEHITTFKDIEEYYLKYNYIPGIKDIYYHLLVYKYVVFEIVLKLTDEFLGYMILDTEFWYNTGISFRIRLSDKYNKQNYKNEIIIETANYLVSKANSNILFPKEKENMREIFAKTDYTISGDYDWDIKYKINLIEKIESDILFDLKNAGINFFVM